METLDGQPQRDYLISFVQQQLLTSFKKLSKHKHYFVKPTNNDLTRSKNLMSSVSSKTCDISIFQRSPGRGSDIAHFEAYLMLKSTK